MNVVGDVLRSIEQLAAPGAALTGDPIGHQVGDLSSKVTRIVLSLDHSCEAIAYAASVHAELLVTHHPLLYGPQNSLTSDSHVGRAVAALSLAKISHIAAHTNWDAAYGGVNDTLATMLELGEIKPFGTRGLDLEQSIPIGRIGRLPNAMTTTDLIAEVDAKLSTTATAWGDPKKRINRIACVGGAASDEWELALLAGADAFLTGEVKQHHALDASEAGLVMLAAGHYATEQPGIIALQDKLKAKLPALEFLVFIPAKGFAGRPVDR